MTETPNRLGSLERARTLLRADAALCGASGIALIAAAPPLATLADGEPVGAVRAVGAFLVLVAIDYYLAARTRADRVAAAATVVGAVNVLWILGTLAVVAAGPLEPLGAALGLGGAAIAGGFAWLEFRAAAAARLLPTGHPTGKDTHATVA
jgi:hypothetical protein